MSTGNLRPARGTPNFNWPIPGDADPADYVTDTGKLGDAIDATVGPLPGKEAATRTRLASYPRMHWCAINGANGAIVWSANTTDSGYIAAGRGAQGIYNISFSQAFSAVPLLFVTPWANFCIPNITVLTANSAQVTWALFPSGANTDTSFHLLALGPPLGGLT